MLSAALPAGVVGQALRFLLDGRAVVPDLLEERIRLADTLQGELDALTDKIAALEHSRVLLTKVVADVRGAMVGPGSPGDLGGDIARSSVRKAGPAVGASTRP